MANQKVQSWFTNANLLSSQSEAKKQTNGSIDLILDKSVNNLQYVYVT